MRFDSFPVLTALKSALDYNAARSRVLAANVANADTPGYTPQDIAEGDFAAALKASGGTRREMAMIAESHPGHLSPPSNAVTRSWRTGEAPDAETTLDGNAVVLEEQMAKVAETRMRYEAALGLYEKTLGLLRLAVRSPGR